LEEQLFELNPGTTLYQPENGAVRILPFSSAVPFVRLRANQPNHPSTADSKTDQRFAIGKRGIRFTFLTAAGLMYPDESSVSGSRWAETESSVTFAGPASIGQTLRAPTIHDLGALLTWRLESLEEHKQGLVQRFAADIYLVCRVF
jgi:hypothetical protein